MEPQIPHLLSALIGAEQFESAAEVVLRPLLAHSARALLASPFGKQGRMLRAIVHLRPEGSYRGLALLEDGQEHCTTPEGEAMLPSLTVWRMVESRKCRIALDVMVGQVTSNSGPIEIIDGLVGDEAGEDATASRGRLLSREATHLLCLPLQVAPGHVVGMISLEANCPAAMGQRFFWDDCAADLQLLCDLSAPYLLARPPRKAPRPARTGDALLPVVGPSMAGLISVLEAFSPHDETILLMGPTGTGKTRLARWCHELSPRRAAPLQIADLSSVPRDLQLAELFGWRRGSFTGAIADHTGWVGQAEGGTLLLDEIDKLSLEAQAGLLYLLEERRYRVLGDTAATRQANVRFLVGTNVDLRTAMKEGRFREDLYYRINVLPVQLLPLRERRDEIIPWAEFMIERRHKEGGGAGAASLAPEAEPILSTFPWPGNLRQLDNVIRRAYMMACAELGEGQAIEVGARHVKQALGFEREREGASLQEILWRAARAYALEAERWQARGQRLPLDLAQAFDGLVLSAAATLRGGRKEAFLLLGLDTIVENRNHTKQFKQALARLFAALEAMGEEPDAELRAQIKE